MLLDMFNEHRRLVWSRGSTLRHAYRARCGKVRIHHPALSEIARGAVEKSVRPVRTQSSGLSNNEAGSLPAPDEFDPRKALGPSAKAQYYYAMY